MAPERFGTRRDRYTTGPSSSALKAAVRRR